jgi:hypothetical protein
VNLGSSGGKRVYGCWSRSTARWKRRLRIRCGAGVGRNMLRRSSLIGVVRFRNSMADWTSILLDANAPCRSYCAASVGDTSPSGARQMANQCVVCKSPSEYICMYCRPTSFYCSAHKCAHLVTGSPHPDEAMKLKSKELNDAVQTKRILAFVLVLCCLLLLALLLR